MFAVQVRSHTAHPAGAAEEHPETLWQYVQTVSLNILHLQFSYTCKDLK